MYLHHIYVKHLQTGKFHIKIQLIIVSGYILIDLPLYFLVVLIIFTQHFCVRMNNKLMEQFAKKEKFSGKTF